MKFNEKCLPLCLLIAFLCKPAIVMSQDGEKIESPSKEELLTEAQSAMKVLRRCCARCHKGNNFIFDAASVESMTDSGQIDPGDASSSYLLDLINHGTMPPKNRPQLPRPTPEEADTIESWINNGALEPPVEARQPIELQSELEAVYRHLANARAEDVPNLRYFTLRNLFNDASNVDAFQLMITRAALSKALNSMSWENDIVLPIAIDANGSPIPSLVENGVTVRNAAFDQAVVYAVNINQLGWTRQHWNAILKRYPYALSYEGHDNQELDNLANKIFNLRRARDPAILRADWFVSVATRPPVYHEVLYELRIPELLRRPTDETHPTNPKRMTDHDLESFLGIDVARNIVTGRAKRSGFTESGVSGQNRLIERHAMARNGAYWKSYDFKDSNRRSILTEFPLGPKFEQNPYNAVAFSHDGGEIIFNLPNGLQAYLLVDGEGNRIDAGPIEVVGDSLKTSGNEQIVTGVSCMACHRSGMISSPNDEVRQFSSLAGDQRRLLQELYPESEMLEDLMEDDSEVFVASLSRAIDVFIGSHDVDELPEPISEVSRRFFLEPIQIATMAAELDISVDDLKAGLKVNSTLQELGLRVILRNGGSIKRAAWQSGEGRNPTALTLMKEVAREFGYSPRQ